MNIWIRVQDPDPRHTAISGLVRILVKDVNDNAPVFRISEVNVTLSEDDEEVKSVANFTAVDDDDGINGEIEYVKTVCVLKS